MTPLRLTLLGGASASGKTVWLQHQIGQGAFANVAVIAAAPGQELALLRRCCAETSHAEAPRHTVMELHPDSDPASLRTALGADPELAAGVNISEILVVIDASLGASQLSRFGRTRRQAVAADGIILSKLDESADAPLKGLIATLRLINPKAALFGAAHGAERELPSDYGVYPEAPPDLGDDRALTHAVVEIDAAMGWPAFSLWLSALLHARGADIVRFRACVGAPSGGVLLHGALGETLAAEMVHEVAVPRGGYFAVMGRGFQVEELTLSLQAFVCAQD